MIANLRELSKEFSLMNILVVGIYYVRFWDSAMNL
jgi:hypothetical protein